MFVFNSCSFYHKYLLVFLAGFKFDTTMLVSEENSLGVSFLRRCSEPHSIKHQGQPCVACGMKQHLSGDIEKYLEHERGYLGRNCFRKRKQQGSGKEPGVGSISSVEQQLANIWHGRARIWRHLLLGTADRNRASQISDFFSHFQLPITYTYHLPTGSQQMPLQNVKQKKGCWEYPHNLQDQNRTENNFSIYNVFWDTLYHYCGSFEKQEAHE